MVGERGRPGSGGCRVTICARGETRLAEAARELRRLAGRKPDGILAVAADLASETGVEQVIGRTVETFGGLDILVNNTGLARGTTIVETADDEWREALDQTLWPAIRASRSAAHATPGRRRHSDDRVDLGA